MSSDVARSSSQVGEVAYVDHLDDVLGLAGREDLSAAGEALGPVGEATGRVTGTDDQPGADDHAGRRL